jgi:hypothetical protein
MIPWTWLMVVALVLILWYGIPETIENRRRIVGKREAAVVRADLAAAPGRRHGNKQSLAETRRQDAENVYYAGERARRHTIDGVPSADLGPAVDSRQGSTHAVVSTIRRGPHKPVSKTTTLRTRGMFSDKESFAGSNWDAQASGLAQARAGTTNRLSNKRHE